MTYTALLATAYYVGEVGDGPDHPAQCRPGAAALDQRAARQHPQLHAPAAVNGRLQTCQRVADMILGALAQVVPERVMACSNSACTVAYFIGKRPPTDPNPGSTWVYLETIGGGSGARSLKDGLDGVHVHTTNTSNLPVEALEIEYPLILMRYELVAELGRRRPLSRRHGAAARLPGDARLPRPRRPHAPALAELGPVRRRARRARPRRGRTRRRVRRRPGGAEGGPMVRPGDSGRGRLRPAGRARSRGGGARSRRGRDHARGGRRHLRLFRRVRLSLQDTLSLGQSGGIASCRFVVLRA